MDKKKKNILIGGLLALVLLMAVGYAAFATNLSIGGSSSIDSRWDVLITNLTSTTTGTASDNHSTYDRLTANLSAELVKPGDSITYQVTVTNRGTLDAILSSIEKTTVTNDYIEVTYSGLEENDSLYKGESRVLTIVVAFKDVDIEKLTDDISVNFSVTLNYTQKETQYNPEQIVTINYSSAYDTSIQPEQVYLGDTINPPEAHATGYKFDGWFTHKNGKGTQAVAGIPVIRLYNDSTDKSKTEDSFPLYAYWKPIQYTIIRDTQEGEICSNITKNVGQSNLTSTCNPQKEGYTLDAWYTSPNGEGLKVVSTTKLKEVLETQYYPGIGEVPDNTVTIYANWIEN